MRQIAAYRSAARAADILLTEDFNVLLLNKGVKASMLAGVLVAVPTVANAATAMLASNDYVGISFWTISMAMVAATVFFLMEAGRLSGKWKTSMTVGALGHPDCCGSLLLHERRVGRVGRDTNRLSLCRLVNHCAASDGRILLHLSGSYRR